MDMKTKIGDQVQVISDVGRRYKAAEVNAQSLEAEIKSLETTAMKTKRLMDVAEKAHLAATAAKDRARILAEHVRIAVSIEAGKMESSGGSESCDAAESVQTALMTMKAARAATVALEALDTSLEASKEVSTLTAARISNKRRELALIAKDKDAYHGLLQEEVHVGKALLDIANGNRPGEGTKSSSAAGDSSDKMVGCLCERSSTTSACLRKIVPMLNFPHIPYNRKLTPMVLLQPLRLYRVAAMLSLPAKSPQEPRPPPRPPTPRLHAVSSTRRHRLTSRVTSTSSCLNQGGKLRPRGR